MGSFTISPEEFLVRSTAQDLGVDPDQAARIAHAESGFDQTAVSPKGARGVMQLMPTTAKDLGVDPGDMASNIEGGVRYYKTLLDRYNGDERKAAAAYNAGPERVDSGKPLPAETQAYIDKVAPVKDFTLSPEDFLKSGPKTSEPTDFTLSPEDFLKSASTNPTTTQVVAPSTPVAAPAPGVIPGMERLGGVPPAAGQPPPVPSTLQPHQHIVGSLGQFQPGAPETGPAPTREQLGYDPQFAQKVHDIWTGAELQKKLAVDPAVLHALPPDIRTAIVVAQTAAGLASPENLATMIATDGMAGAFKAAANTPRLAKLLADFPGVRQAIDKAASAAIPATFSGLNAYQGVKGGVEAVNAHEQGDDDKATQYATQAVTNLIFAALGAVGARQAIKETSAAYPSAEATAPAGQRPIRPIEQQLAEETGITPSPRAPRSKVPPAEAAARAADLLSQGKNLAAQDWLALAQGGMPKPIDLPENVLGEPGKIESMGRDKDGRPYFRVVGADGKPIFGGTGPSVSDFLQQRQSARTPEAELPEPRDAEVVRGGQIVQSYLDKNPQATAADLEKEFYLAPAEAAEVAKAHGLPAPETKPLADIVAGETKPSTDIISGAQFQVGTRSYTVKAIENGKVTYSMEGATSKPVTLSVPLTVFQKTVAAANPAENKAAPENPAVTSPQATEEFSVTPEEFLAKPPEAAQPQAQAPVAPKEEVIPQPTAQPEAAGATQQIPQYQEMVDAVREVGKASTSTLQRKFRLGHGAAAQVLDQMEKDGIIGPSQGSAPREVLATGNVPRGAEPDEQPATQPAPEAQLPTATAPSGNEQEKGVAEPPKLSSTQVNLPADVSEKARDWIKRLPFKSLHEEGVENEPHVTVRYGIHDEDPVATAKALEGEGPITAKLGAMSVFKGATPEDPDVLKIDVTSPDLHRLNAKVGELPHTDTYPTYVPHITLGYFKRGAADKYIGKIVPGVSGKTITLNNVTFSSKNGQKTEIPLRGKVETPETHTVADGATYKDVRSFWDRLKAGDTIQTPQGDLDVTGAHAFNMQPVLPTRGGLAPIGHAAREVTDVTVKMPDGTERKFGHAGALHDFASGKKEEAAPQPATVPVPKTATAKPADLVLTGNTYPSRYVIKRLGAKWNKKDQTWSVADTEENRAAVAAMKGVEIQGASKIRQESGENSQTEEKEPVKKLASVAENSAKETPAQFPQPGDRVQVNTHTGMGGRPEDFGVLSNISTNGKTALVKLDNGEERQFPIADVSKSTRVIPGKWKMGDLVTYDGKPYEIGFVGGGIVKLQDRKTHERVFNFVPQNSEDLKHDTHKQAEAEESAAQEAPGARGLADAVYNILSSGKSLGNVTELNKLAERAFGSARTSGQWTPKDAFDAMEAGINRYLIEEGKSLMEMPAEEGLKELRDLMSRITSQGTRTEEQDKFQQFSTPPTESYVVSKVADLRPEDIVLEPSAGTGGLAVWPKAIGAKVYVNEISERRREMLELAGFGEATAHDGEIINAMLPPGIKPTVVLMNPPFSAGGAKSGPAKNTNQYGFNHVDSALQRLAPGGRLVVILGGGRADDVNGGATLIGGPSGTWFKGLAKRYNIRANIRVEGKEYQKYGTAFATRIIVIDKDGPTPSQVQTDPDWSSVIRANAQTLEQAYNLLRDVAGSRPAIGQEGTAAEPHGKVQTGEGESGTAEAGVAGQPQQGTGSVQPSRTGTRGQRGTGRQPVPGGSDQPGEGLGAGAAGERVGASEPATRSEESPKTSSTGATQSVSGSVDESRPLTRQEILDAARKKFAESRAPQTKPEKSTKAAKATKPKQVAAPQEKAVSPAAAAAAEAQQRMRDRMAKKAAQTGEEPVRFALIQKQPPKEIDSEDLVDLAAMGAGHIVDGALTFPEFSERMLGEVGDMINYAAANAALTPDDVLRQVYDFASEIAKDYGVIAEPLPPNVPRDVADAKLSGDGDMMPLELERNLVPKSEVDDSVAYVEYHPTLKGPAHPGSIVETKTMSTVPLPPITYKPNLPASVLQKGTISAVQLEAIALAGQQNETLLPDGSRSMLLIGDGTGVGKGREAAGILWDNYRNGKKRLIWLSQNWDLMQDAMRDLEGVGATEMLRGNERNAKGQFTTTSKSFVRPMSDFKYGDNIKHDGLLYLTYGTARGKDKKGNRRIKQIEDYLRGDDDGDGAYIIIDEAHNLKNAVVGGRAKASQQGVAIRELLHDLPKLGVTALSATAATDVINLGWMDRLGIWGPGTAFPTGFNEFAAAIASGRTAAMEMIASELKAQGKYLSRTLSFKGVEFNEEKHELTDEQKAIYRTAADAWKQVFKAGNETIQKTTNGGSDQKARFNQSMGGAQQRFFNLLITALKTPTAIELANKALADGKSVTITMVNTGEAAQNREKNRVAAARLEGEDEEDEIPEYDFGPKQILIDLIRESYPTQQYRDDVDDNGNPIKLPVTRIDEEGREVAVHNPEAVAARDALIAQIDKDLHMPDNPLDILINSLGGPKKVAELTGRKERYDSSTGKFVPRGDQNVARKNINISEMRNFQSGKKRVAILTGAANAGISLHSSLDVANQQPRYQITLQVGWEADKAMQMLGRTHRTNQAHPPEYVLLYSDLAGEKRFISTISRRLGSLGALTKGQKNASTGTDLMDKVNLETAEGRAATTAFYEQLMRNVPVPGTGLTGLQVLTDLRILKGTPPTVPQADRPNVTKLLNRLMALDPDIQNSVYNYFYDIFQATIERAIEAGTLDTGVKSLPGDEFTVKEQKSIAKDPKTGAETFYYPVDAKVRTHRVSPADLEKRMKQHSDDNPVIVRGSKGNLGLAIDAPPIVHASGSVEPAVYFATPDKGKWVKVPAYRVSSYQTQTVEDWAKKQLEEAESEVTSAQRSLEYQQRDAERSLEFERGRMRRQGATEEDISKFQLPEDKWEARNLKETEQRLAEAQTALESAKEIAAEPMKWAKEEWERQYEDAPSHIVDEHHLIGRAVMRYWNAIRDASQFSDIYTTTDSKTGKRVVGVDIPADAIGQLLQRISGGGSTVNARQLHVDVLRNNVTYTLEGGIQVRRGTVGRQGVIQLIAPTQEIARNLQALGAVYERGVTPVYYVANNTSGPEKTHTENIIERILDQYPVQPEGPIALAREAPGLYTGSMRKSVMEGQPLFAKSRQIAADANVPQTPTTYRNGILWVSSQTMNAITETLGLGRNVAAGMYVPPSRALALQKVVTGPLHEAIADALREGNSLVIVRHDAGQPISKSIALARHELFHAAEEWMGQAQRGHTLLENPLASKAAETLKHIGYSDIPSILFSEIGAHLAEGPLGWQKLDLKPEEAQQLWKEYLALTPASVVAKLDRIAPQLKEELYAAQVLRNAEVGLDTRGGRENETPEEGAGRGPVRRGVQEALSREQQTPYERSARLEKAVAMANALDAVGATPEEAAALTDDQWKLAADAGQVQPPHSQATKDEVVKQLKLIRQIRAQSGERGVAAGDLLTLGVRSTTKSLKVVAAAPDLKALGAKSNAVEALQSALEEESDKNFGEKLRTFVTGERDVRIAETNQLRDKLKKLVPNPVQQEALTLMRDFKNKDEDLFRFFTGQHEVFQHMSPEEMKDAEGRMVKLAAAIQSALDPTPEMLEADAELTKYFTDHLAEGRKLGFLDSKISNEEYITHLLQPAELSQKASLKDRIFRSGKLGPRKFKFAKERFYPTVLHAVANGLGLRTLNALDALTIYGDKYATTAAYHLFLRAVKDSAAGKWGTYSQQKAGKIPVGWVELAPESRLFRNEIPFVTEEGEAQVAHQNLFVPPRIEQVMRPIFDPNYMARVPGFQKGRTYQAYIKAVELGLSVFHLKALNITALGNEGLSGLVGTYISDMDSPDFLDAEKSWIRAGLTTPILGRAIEAYQALQPSSLPTTAERIRSLPGLTQIDQVAASITHLTFGIVQRKLKVTDASVKYARWLEGHPEATPAEAFEAQRLISKEINAVYGGLHWENLGVNRVTQEIARALMLAPDWTFSNIFNVGQAFTGGPGGNAARIFWIRSIIVGLALTAGLSLLLSRKLSKDPTRVRLGRERNGKELDDNVFFVGALSDVSTLIHDVNKYGAIVGLARVIGNKMGPFVRAGVHLTTNTDQLGRPVVPKKTNENLLGRKVHTHAPGFWEKTALGAEEFSRDLAPVPFSVSTLARMILDKKHKYTMGQYAESIVSGRQPAAASPSR